MKTRTGKIARLPRSIRNELNQRLDDGEEGKKLVRWLNRMPEARAVLMEYFEGKAITEQNLSDWKAGGFAEWQQRQEFLEQAKEQAEEAEELGEISQSNRTSLAEHLTTVLALRYARVLKEWQGETNETAMKQLRLLHGLSHDVARLARVGLERQRVELTREKSQHELVDLFSEWVEIPAVREAVCEDYVTLEDRRRVLSKLYNRPYGEEEIRRPKSEGRRKARGQGSRGKGRKAYGGRERKRGTRGGCGPRAGTTSAFRGEVLGTTRGRKRWLKDPTTCDARGRVRYQTTAEKKALAEAAGQKRLDEGTARAYIRQNPNWKKEGAEKGQGNERQGNQNSSDQSKARKQSGSSGGKPLSPLGRGEGENSACQKNAAGMGVNQGQSSPIVPKAMEAVVARLNAGKEGDLPEDEVEDKAESGKAESGNDCDAWEREDEMILKEAEEAHRRREMARREEDEKRLAEENRLWRVKAGFDEPTEDDVALGQGKK